MNVDDVSFSFEKCYAEEEVESPSFPGVITVYRKEIVNATFGGTVKDFMHTNKENTTKKYRWLTKKECEEKHVNLDLSGFGSDDASTGLVQAPVGMLEEHLTAFLQQNDVNIDQFGTGKAKTLKEFSAELRKGESTLMKGPDGKLTRIVDIVVMLVYKPDGKEILIETEERRPDGESKAASSKRPKVEEKEESLEEEEVIEAPKKKKARRGKKGMSGGEQQNFVTDKVDWSKVTDEFDA